VLNQSVILTIKNEKGFSLIEAMIGLFIFVVVVTLYSTIAYYWMFATHEVNTFSYEEYVLFVNHLQAEFRESDTYWVDENEERLFIIRPLDNQIVHYEKYKNTVRRQVRGMGHEVFLQRVTDFRVVETAYGIKVEVAHNNITWQKNLIHPATELTSSDLIKEGEDE
jgi:competence protein ComGF